MARLATSLSIFLLGLVFLSAAGIFLMLSGLLGEHAKTAATALWDSVVAYQGLIQGTFAVATAIVGSLGVFRSWHFAEINLPARLQSMVSKRRISSVLAREQTLPALGAVSSITLPVAATRTRIAGFIVWLAGGEQRALARCSVRLAAYEAQLGVFNECTKRCRSDIATTYLKLGDLLARCDKNRGEGVLSLFKKPLEYDGVDQDALELSARQAVSIGLDAQAAQYLEKLAAATSAEGNRIRHARAARFQSELLLRVGTRGALDEARGKLTANISVLARLEGESPSSRAIELAFSYLTLAEVQLERERLSAAGDALQQAQQLFPTLPAPHGPAGNGRVKELTERLSKSRGDPDNSD